MARTPLLPLADALSQLLAGKGAVDTETVDLADAAARVLADDLIALRTQPPFPASAMDGYAVRHQDLATDRALSVVGQSAAGHPFEGPIEPRQTVRIFTGGVVPEGADTILIQENASGDDGAIVPTDIPQKGVFVRKAGLDFSEGDRLLTAASALGPEAIALAAAGNHASVTVRRKPRVGIIATGDELRLPGQATGPGEIIASNSYGIAALCERHGAQGIDLGIARDNEASLTACIQGAIDANCDVLVTLGGASVGDHDIVQPVLKAMGMDLSFWKIAMRPGKPLMTGSLGDMTVLGLPGNPVSAMVCGHVFLAPLIRVLLGQSPEPEIVMAKLSHDLPANGDREHYMRAVVSTDADGERVVAVFDNQDSSVLSLLAQANGLVIRPPHDGALKADDRVRLQLL